MMNRKEEMKKTAEGESKDASRQKQNFSGKVADDVETRFKSKGENPNERDERRPKSGKGV
jgi:hypothetical protein